MSIKPTELRSAPVRPALPPRTGGLPIVGALPAFVRRPFDFLREARKQHGDIFTLDLGVTRWVILNHPRQADYVLREHSQNYRKGSGLWDTIRELMGNGLVVSEGDFWLRQRRMIQPQFHRKRLAELADAMVAATVESLEFWETAARTGRPCDALANFSAVTMRVIARALFGQGLRGAEIERVSEQMAFVMDYLMLGAITSTLPAWLPIPGARRFRYAIRELDQVVMQIIAEERQAPEPSDSMLAMLLHMVDADTGEQMTDTQLHDEVMTFFTAGYETTSLSLAWTIHFLTQHPAVMEQVRAEIDHTLGGRPPAFADLAGLNYTRMVIQESMRLCSPSWMLPRTAIADDEIDGFAIPAGTNVVALTYGIHHNPDVWEDPERFDPQRFADERLARQHKLAWMPFGAGQRQCIGRDFAMMEAQIILATLMQRYTFTGVPGQVATPKLSATFKPKNGVLVNLAPRGDV